jgi:hypothetical protein
VINWKQTLKIPANIPISPEAKSLIFGLCTDADSRLDCNRIKSHPFFRNFDFGPNLRRSKAPYIPTILHPTDTSNFEPIDHSIIAKRQARLDEINRHQLMLRQHQSSDLNDSQASPMLYEFTFRRFFDEASSSDSTSGQAMMIQMRNASQEDDQMDQDNDGYTDTHHKHVLSDIMNENNGNINETNTNSDQQSAINSAKFENGSAHFLASNRMQQAMKNNENQNQSSAPIYV